MGAQRAPCGRHASAPQRSPSRCGRCLRPPRPGPGETGERGRWTNCSWAASFFRKEGEGRSATKKKMRVRMMAEYKWSLALSGFAHVRVSSKCALLSFVSGPDVALPARRFVRVAARFVRLEAVSHRPKVGVGPLLSTSPSPTAGTRRPGATAPTLSRRRLGVGAEAFRTSR